MAIRYLNTYHECQCDCGQQFFVQAGRTFNSKKKLPARITTSCPACGAAGMLSRLRDISVIKQRKADGFQHKTRILFEDLPAMEAALQRSQRSSQLHYTHWVNLRAHVLQAIAFWEEHWQRTIMPTYFLALIRCLREQQSELRRHFPPAAKDFPCE